MTKPTSGGRGGGEVIDQSIVFSARWRRGIWKLLVFCRGFVRSGSVFFFVLRSRCVPSYSLEIKHAGEGVILFYFPPEASIVQYLQ